MPLQAKVVGLWTRPMCCDAGSPCPGRSTRGDVSLEYNRQTVIPMYDNDTKPTMSVDEWQRSRRPIKPTKNRFWCDGIRTGRQVREAKLVVRVYGLDCGYRMAGLTLMAITGCPSALPFSVPRLRMPPNQGN